MNNANKNNGKQTGFAIIALRATIKALELNKGQYRSKGEYRYELPKAANPDPAATARICLESSGETVDGQVKLLDEWVKSGKQIRLAFIGLKDAKTALDEQAGKPVARFMLNAISGEAYLTVKGQRLEDKPSTVADWSKIGREVEKPLFDALKRAQELYQTGKEYGSVDGERDGLKEMGEIRARMIALGVIRDPRQESDNS